MSGAIDRVRSQVSGRAWEQVWDLARRRVSARVRVQAADQVWALVRGQVGSGLGTLGR